MMWKKAKLMGDEEVAERVLQADTPAKAKQLGREVKNFKQEIWDRECDSVVEAGNYHKFTQNRKLGDILLATGERAIVETSPNDKASKPELLRVLVLIIRSALGHRVQY